MDSVLVAESKCVAATEEEEEEEGEGDGEDENDEEEEEEEEEEIECGESAMQSISSSMKRTDISSTATARTDTFRINHLSRRLIARS